MVIFGWITLAIAACILLFVVSLIDDWGRDWTQNHAKLDPANRDAELHPLMLSATPAQVADHVATWVAADSRWHVEKVEDHGDRVDIHLTRSTDLMRFTDDIRVKITATEGGCRVDAESQSRVGKGDLGQNPRNLKELIRSLTDWRQV